jgi:2-polyprenyl-3-methyl-5-hydroxy-6-metoxy-1,4-benzoquinol methylase
MTLDYAAQYAKFHPNDHGHRNGLTLLHHRMLGPLLPSDRAAPILDVGCGRGYALQDIQALGYTNINGIDTDAGQVDFARAQGLAVSREENTAAFLASKPGAYAVILLMDVLEHLPREDQPAFLRAIATSLRPGGRLICSVPNAASEIASYWLHNDYTHQWSFTGDGLAFLLEQCGFRDVRCTGVEFFVRPRLLFWLPTPRTVAWWLRCLFRLRQRLVYAAELGWARGRGVVLTPNLLAVAEKAG